MIKGHFARRASGWIFTLAVTYLVFCISLALMQRGLMYAPNPARFTPADFALSELQPLEAKSRDGLTITSWYHPPQQQHKFTIVFFQGNAFHLGYRNYKIRPWLDAGYGVLLVGYRGFGNQGSPSEEGIYQDARSALDELHKKGLEDKALIFYGESLGSGVAVQMATEFPPAAIILESPYTSVPAVGADRYPMVPVRWLLRDTYDSLDKIKNVHAPLLLLHGMADQVIPIRFGQQLFEAANEPKQAEYVPDAGHYDVYTLHTQQVVLDFIARLPTDALLPEPNGEAAGKP